LVELVDQAALSLRRRGSHSEYAVVGASLAFEGVMIAWVCRWKSAAQALPDPQQIHLERDSQSLSPDAAAALAYSISSSAERIEERVL